MLLGRLRNPGGFTLIEMLLVVAILAVLALLAIPRLTGTIQDSADNMDIANLAILNRATAVYAEDNDTRGHVFDGLPDDEARMQVLVDAHLLGQAVAPQQQNTCFMWNGASQCWELSASGSQQ